MQCKKSGSQFAWQAQDGVKHLAIKVSYFPFHYQMLAYMATPFKLNIILARARTFRHSRGLLIRHSRSGGNPEKRDEKNK
jgi:hypothetical protein